MDDEGNLTDASHWTDDPVPNPYGEKRNGTNFSFTFLKLYAAYLR